MADDEHPAPLRILIVEDNPADAELLVAALKTVDVDLQLEFAEDGDLAMERIRAGQFDPATMPDLLFLDLNLPRMNGREVLAEMKAEADLRKIPIVVMSSSGAERDVDGAYDLQANAYVIKPVDFETLNSIVAAIRRFWFEAATLPRRR